MFTTTSPEITIGRHRVGRDHPVFIIAEIGATHHGKVEYALKLIELAAQCGAQATKLQTVNPDYSYCKGTLSHNIFTELQLSYEDLVKMKKAADALGIILFTTPGDFPSLELAKKLGFELMKVSSGLMTNAPLVEAVAKTGRPMIISSGMAYLDEIGRSVRVAREAGAAQIAALHCTSVYPAGDDLLNLRAIDMMSDALQIPVGYSDHSPDAFAAAISVAAGACIIEKHLAISHELAGPEAGTACDPDEFRRTVDAVRRASAVLGVRAKRPNQAEMEGRRLFRRSVISRRPIRAGARIGVDDVGLMRGTIEQIGLPPEMYPMVLGMVAAADIGENQPIHLGMLREP